MSYFTQVVEVDRSYRGVTRHDFVKSFIKDKKVLHVGFADYPITKPKKNLHLYIASECRRLDGIDPNIDEINKEILTVTNGQIYDSWNHVPNDYDIILVPEVIEHVDNVASFLQFLDNYQGMLIVTAPCAFTLKNNFNEENGIYTETVHPDHNCWYSPYTLKNVLNKYCKTRQVSKIYLINSSVAAVCERI